MKSGHDTHTEFRQSSTTECRLGRLTGTRWKVNELNITRSKILISAGIGLSLALATGILFASNLAPFENKGDILASDVCTSLGRTSRTVAALKEVLPDEPSYSFSEDTTDPRTDDTDGSYASACFIYGDNQQLAAITAELLEYDKTGNWVKDVVEQRDTASSLTPFTAGDRAVASDKVAAIYVPCSSNGANLHLSVVVHLKKQRATSESVLRKGLISLAGNAASYEHNKARCDLISKVQTSFQ